MEVFGFHRVDENLFTEEDYSFTETYYDAQNVLNVLGWFPLVGTVIGCIRVGATVVMWIGDDESHKSDHGKYYIVSNIRGIIEALGFGLIFIIPDIIASFRPKRRLQNARAKSMKAKSLKKKISRKWKSRKNEKQNK